MANLVKLIQKAKMGKEWQKIAKKKTGKISKKCGEKSQNGYKNGEK